MGLCSENKKHLNKDASSSHTLGQQKQMNLSGKVTAIPGFVLDFAKKKYWLLTPNHKSKKAHKKVQYSFNK